MTKPHTTFFCCLYLAAAVGISFVQFTNNNSIRNIYVLGLSLFLGISIPQYFVMNTAPDGHGPVRTHGGWVSDLINSLILYFIWLIRLIIFFQLIVKVIIWIPCVLWQQFNDILNTIFSSPPTVAIIVGTVLDNTLEAKQTAVDRGLPWWTPFQNKKGDVRNDEFYRFPLRLTEYIPTRFL